MTAPKLALITSLLITLNCLAEDKSDPTIEVILVTSDRTEKNILELPATLTVIDSQFLESLQINNLEDLQTSVPGLSVTNAGGESQIYLRGIGNSSTGITSDPSIAILLDGVYLPRAQYGSLPFIDIERIEIMKGPQGSLYGRNATGGVINIISKSAEYYEETELRAAMGSHNYQSIGAVVNRPLSDDAAFRLALQYNKDDGYTKNLFSSGSGKIDDQEVFTIRSSVKTNIGAQSTVWINADHTDHNSNNNSIRPLDELSLAGSLGADLNTGFNQTRNNLMSYDLWQSSGININVNVPFSQAKVSWTSAYRHYQSDFLFNTDGTEIDIARTYVDFDFNQTSHDLLLQSVSSGAFSWMMGAQFLGEDNRGTLGLGRGTHPTFGIVSFIIPNQTEVEASSIFGQLGYRFNKQLKLTTDIRLSKETKRDATMSGAISNDIQGIKSTGTITPFSQRRANESWHDASPRVIFTYQPHATRHYYLSFTEGFKSGGWSAYDTNGSYDPEKIKAVEFGLKSTLSANHQFTGSLFYYDYSDLQVSVFKDGLAQTTNAAKAITKGIDIQGNFKLNDRLAVHYSAEWLDAFYTDYLSTFGKNIADVSGNRLANSPKQSFSSLLNYEIPGFLWGSLKLGLNLNYQSQVFHSPQNESILSKSSLTLTNFNAEYHFPDERWKLNFWVKNITDAKYFYNKVRFTSLSQGNPMDVNNIGAAMGYPAPGRSIGLSFIKYL